MLLHLRAELGHDRLVEFEKIKRVVPAAGVGAARRIPVVLHQPSSQCLQPIIQMPRPVLTRINPGREQRLHGDLDGLRFVGRYARGIELGRFCAHGLALMLHTPAAKQALKFGAWNWGNWGFSFVSSVCFVVKFSPA